MEFCAFFFECTLNVEVVSEEEIEVRIGQFALSIDGTPVAVPVAPPV